MDEIIGITFEKVPQAFGLLHLLILAAIAILVVALVPLLRKAKEKTLTRILFVMGCAMLIAEILKQLFVERYIYQGEPATWFFPWQLCSMAMYLCFGMPFLEEKGKDIALTFLATFSLVAALAALVFPGDMLRPQILLFTHSFLYHAAMILESVIAIILLRRRQKTHFWPSIILFCGMAVVAEIINVASHCLVPDRKLAANMFNITPYYPSTQPVFHNIALALGIIPEIIIYLGVIVLLSFVVFILIGIGRRKS